MTLTRNDKAGLPAGQYACLAALLLALDLVLELFQFVDWDHGLAKVALLAALGLGFAVLKFFPLRFRDGTETGTRLTRIMPTLVLVLGVIAAGIAIGVLYRTAATGQINLDQGQNLYRADLGLLRGENPYGRGALLDIEAYRVRMPERIAAGIAPALAPAQIEPTLETYWRTFDPELRSQLLPLPLKGNDAAEEEYSILGYKYGPVIVLLTLPFAAMLGPIAAPLGTMLALGVTFLTVWNLLRGNGASRAVATLAVASLLLNIQLITNFVIFTASDIWPLMFGFLGLLSTRQGHRIWPAVLVGLAMGCKIFPGILFLPILIIRPSWRALAALCATGAVIAGPWLLLDAHGFLLNMLWWGARMQPDSTSWVYFAPGPIIAPIKILLACGALMLAAQAARDFRRGEYPYWTMALLAICVIPLGSAFHNNYLSWFSLWAVLAATQWAGLSGKSDYLFAKA